MAELFADALKFGGAVMIRRIVGIAHVDDFKEIQDEVVRYAIAIFSPPCHHFVTTLSPPCHHPAAHKHASARQIL